MTLKATESGAAKLSDIPTISPFSGMFGGTEGCEEPAAPVLMDCDQFESLYVTPRTARLTSDAKP